MAGVFSGERTGLVVDLGVIGSELVVLQLVVFERVNARNDYVVFLKRIERNLEVENRDRVIVLLVHGSWNASDTNVDLGLDLKFVPIPEEKHPVWLSRQGDDDLVLILG